MTAPVIDLASRRKSVGEILQDALRRANWAPADAAVAVLDPLALPYSAITRTATVISEIAANVLPQGWTQYEARQLVWLVVGLATEHRVTADDRASLRNLLG